MIIGKWLKARGNRDKVILATKLGIEMAPGKKGLSRAYMQTAVEDSLRRLQTDYIDLYQSHRDDPDTPIEETLSGLRRPDQARQGARDRRVELLRRPAGRVAEDQHREGPAALSEPAAALQPGGAGGVRRPLEDLCLAEKIGVIGYYSLASGFLTGKYRSQADTAGPGARLAGGEIPERLWLRRAEGAG